MIWCAFVRYRHSGYFLGSVIVFSVGAYTESCGIRLLFMVINSKVLREVVERYRVCSTEVEPGLEPIRESPNYEIAQVMYCFAIPTATNSLANCTALMIILFGYTEAQLLGLSEELLCLWDDAGHFSQFENGTKTEVMNNFVRQRLKYIIKLHNENIDLLKQLEQVLRVSMALEFLVLMAGLIAALLGGVENTYMEIPFAFAQLFMNCYLGQKIIDASETFETAVYGCRWENFDTANMKTVLIVFQNSQKTLKLSAGGVAILSFQCLMSVVKSSYSFYTTLQSTLK
ncbi:odorant receptor coreceptor-like [Pieris brassicae]|uniref:odorant receptor coreceptor-like n=1 Tax=Pieris brassicae TaxID=7116 RepID=UPI001E65EF39|nr:odorant receptor coreceptor-like [Pieris brassicae]